MFPDQQPLDRTWNNSWRDPDIVEWVEKTDGKKVIIARLWTDICVV
jgi:hypothetical protein